jgi:hypothetical protein
MNLLFSTKLETVWRVLVASISAKTVQKFWTISLAQASIFSAPFFVQKQSPFLTVHRVGVHPRTIFLRCLSNARDVANQIALTEIQIVRIFLSSVIWLVYPSKFRPTEDSFNRIRIFQIPFNYWTRTCVGAENIRKAENLYLLKEEILDWK